MLGPRHLGRGLSWGYQSSMQHSKRLHGTSVEIANKGVLILGPSGSGKSSLARDLLCLGAKLIADDQTLITDSHGQAVLSRPETLPRGIELRGVGIVAVPMADQCALSLVVDLSTTETERLPHPHKFLLFDQNYPLLYGAGLDGLAQSIYLWIRFGTLCE